MASLRTELPARVLTAVVVLPVLLAGLLLAPPVVGVAIVAAALLVGLHEFYGLMRARQQVPFRATGYLLLAGIFIEVASRPEWSAPPLWPMVALVAGTALVLREGDFASTVPAAAGTLLGATYLGALGGTVAGLRVLAPLEDAAARLLLLLAIVMLSDTCAYFTGRGLGRHKLAPDISPGKTLEGALGGLAGGVLGALLVRRLASLEMPVWHACVLGLLVSGLGAMGDLLESVLKRWAGVKDSGRIFPGHGGMLDRLDSLLFGAPVLYYYFTFVR
jgi:phosphatidate cytidylyltransferase